MITPINHLVFGMPKGGQPSGSTLVSYYTFDDYKDETPNEYPLLTASNLYCTPSPNGFGVEFQELTSWYGVQYNENFSFTDGNSDLPFSVVITVKVNIAAHTGVLFNKRGSTSFGEYYLYLSGGKPRIQLLTNTSSNRLDCVTTTDTLSADTWYTLAFTYDGSETSGGLSIYIDGVLSTTTNTASGNYTGMVNALDSPVIVGARGYDYAYSLDGAMSDVALISKELTQTEVTAVHNEIVLSPVFSNGVHPDIINIPYDDFLFYHTFPNIVRDAVGVNYIRPDETLSGRGTYGVILSYMFNQYSDKLILTAPQGLDFTDGVTDLPFSLSFLFRASNTNTELIVTKEDNSLRAWGVEYTGGRLGLKVYSEGDILTYIGRRIDDILTIFTTYHIVITYDGSETSEGITLYVNAVDDSGLVNEQGAYIRMSQLPNSEVYIGGNSTASNKFSGFLDELALYSGQLSQFDVDTIKTMMDNQEHLAPYSPIEYNIEIGGVYPDSILNVTELDAKFPYIDTADVTFFDVDSNDLKIRAEGTWITVEPITGAFQNDLNITSFKTSYPLECSLDGFRGAANLNRIECATFISNRDAFNGCTSLEFDQIIFSNFKANPTPGSLQMFGNLGATTTLDITMITEFFNSGNSVRRTFANNFGIVDMRNVTTMTITGAGNIAYLFALYKGTVRLWSLTTLNADPSVVSGVFGITETQATMVVEINVAMETINGGAPHADIVNAEAYGASFIYTDENGVPQ